MAHPPPPMVNPEDLSDRELLLEVHARMAANDRDWIWFWRIVPTVTLGGAGWMSWLTVLIMTGCALVDPVVAPLAELDRTNQEAAYFAPDASAPRWAEPRGLLDAGPLDHCPEPISEPFHVPAPDAPPRVLD